MPGDRVIVIGAGMGGLACALSLATRGLDVTVVEQAPRAGGKLREITVGGQGIDSGPTVFTMRWVFDALFDAAGTSLEAELGLTKADILARHAWDGGARLDLFADQARSADAITAFAGPAEAARFNAFCTEAATIYRTLKDSFLDAPRPGPIALARRIGFHRPAALFAIRPFETLWRALGKHFHDPRLRQLFGRYATYSGSSPFAAPATLMLIAHVEQDGVWLVDGGMQRLAEALQRVAAARGVHFRFGETVRELTIANGRAAGVVLASGERLAADAVVSNADVSAFAAGAFGPAAAHAAPRVKQAARSQSALTWSLVAQTGGFPLLRHNVFFSPDYRAEFDDVFARGRLPAAPTVYLCAQDRAAADGSPPAGPERLFALVNAPASGDTAPLTQEEIAACATRSFDRMKGCGLTVERLEVSTVTTTPTDFARLFPATGGALYGRASHGWTASFRRPGSASAIPGLYLTGGSAHPGAGVPMAALSGNLAAQRLLGDRASMRPSRRAAISGGISTPSAMTDATGSH
jgi:1-hydroxycarotenoid 3,4-desaturase